MHRIFTPPLASVYSHYATKAEREGRSKEVDEVVRWLTGLDQAELDRPPRGGGHLRRLLRRHHVTR